MSEKREQNFGSDLERLTVKIKSDAKFRKLISKEINTAKAIALQSVFKKFGFNLSKKELRNVY